MNPKFFPAAMIVLDLAASLGYGINGDWRRTIYWIAAAAA